MSATGNRRKIFAFILFAVAVALAVPGIALAARKAERVEIIKLPRPHAALTASPAPASSRGKTAAELAALFRAPARVVVQAPRHTEAPSPEPREVAESASWIRYVGYVTGADGNPYHYFKDTKTGLSLKSGPSGSSPGFSLESASLKSFIVRYGGKLYEIQK